MGVQKNYNKYLVLMPKLDDFQLLLVRVGKFTPCTPCLPYHILQLLLARTPPSLPGESAVCNIGLKPTTLSESPSTNFIRQD